MTIFFDTETTGLQWYHHSVFLVQFFDGKRVDVLQHPQDAIRIQWWLDQKEPFFAWNSKFDLHFLEMAGYRLPAPHLWHDGMVVAHLVDEDAPLSLKKRAEMLLGPQERETEDAIKKWLTDERRRMRKEIGGKEPLPFPPSYQDVPTDLMHSYAAKDVYLVHDVLLSYLDTFKRSGLDEVYNLERDTLEALFAIEGRGLPFEAESAQLFLDRLTQDLEQLEADLAQIANIEDFNPKSSQQLYQALLNRGADLSKVVNQSMDVGNLQTVDDDLAKKVLEFRGEFKLQSTYVEPLLHRTWNSTAHQWREPYITSQGRVHPNYRQVGARTGRMSSSDPNCQNFPRDDLRLRYLVKASEGKKLVSADLDSIELRLFAAFAGQGDLLQTILDGGDLHTLSAKKAGLKAHKRQIGIESARQRGKTLNYAMVYGAGAKSLMKAFAVTYPEAKAIIKNYHEGFPEVKKLQKKLLGDLHSQGYVESLWGRRFRSKDPDKDGYKFINYLVQGTAADLIKTATVNLYKKGIPIIAVIHDEILVECDEKDTKEVMHEVEQALIDHPRITEKVPLSAEACVINRWSEAKDPSFYPNYAPIHSSLLNSNT